MVCLLDWKWAVSSEATLLANCDGRFWKIAAARTWGKIVMPLFSMQRLSLNFLDTNWLIVWEAVILLVLNSLSHLTLALQFVPPTN